MLTKQKRYQVFTKSWSIGKSRIRSLPQHLPFDMASAITIPSGLPTTNGLSMELWKSSQREVYMSLHDPFVQGLAQGTLDRRAFQHYVAQDAYFLKYFARAYGIASSKALALDDETYSTLSRLLHGVHEELQLHGAYAARWGVDLSHLLSSPTDVGSTDFSASVAHSASNSSGSAPEADCSECFQGPSAATKAYTDFLMQVAEEGSVAEILAAMMPCARLYGFLGCTLAAGYGNGSEPPNHEYWEWVKTYSSPEYLEVPALKEAMFDRLQLHEDKAKLLSLYRRAMQLEAEFFAAQPFSPPPRRIAALVVDFDETCTQRDTIEVLLKLAEAAAEAGRPTAGDPQWVRSTLAGLVSGYATAHKELLRELLPEGQPDATLYDGEGLAAFLDHLSIFDERMNVVVEESGILRGSAVSEVAAAGMKVPLRSQCRETLRAALQRDIPVEVLSVHWSDVFVGAALGLPAGGTAREQHTEALLVEKVGAAGEGTTLPPCRAGVVVRCNSLQLGPDGYTTGALVKRVQSARDKCRELQAIRERLVRSATTSGISTTTTTTAGSVSSNTVTAKSSGDIGSGMLVYVGDSASDLAALLAADVGVVVGSNPLLRRVAARFGVRFRPLAAVALIPELGGGSGVLYESAGWEEIRAFLFGVEGPELETTGQVAAVTPEEAYAPLPMVAPEATPRKAMAVKAAAVAAEAEEAPPPASLPRVLSIAGSDSGGGAGIQADMKTMLARGVFGMSALTALTAQNTHGVSAVHAVPPEFLRKQIDAVLSDLGADAIKTGMLPNAEAVNIVAECIRRYRAAATTATATAAAPSSKGLNPPHQPPQLPLLPLVVDPVLVSTSGHSLAESSVAAALMEELLPLATLATPNIPEAEVLLGSDPIMCVEDMRRAAKELQVRSGCGAVLVKGGHLKPAAAAGARAAATANGGTDVMEQLAEVVDVLYDGEQLHELRNSWVYTGNTHGTGCTLASAIAAELAKGLPLLDAVTTASAALHEALRASTLLRLGSGVQRPFHHLRMMTSPPPITKIVHQAASMGVALSQPPVRRLDLAKLRRQLRLYAVTDPHCNRICNRSLLEAVTLAVRGGATIVQLREKDIDGGDFTREAVAALKVCRANGVPLIINDRVDVALAVGADGVHVGQTDLPAWRVRTLIGPDMIMGVSVKTPHQAREAAAAGADYLGAGAVATTGTKDTDVIGLNGLAEVCMAAAPLPVVSIGGVTADNAADTIQAGCAGIAVVSAIFRAEDVEGAARALLQLVDRTLEQNARS